MNCRDCEYPDGENVQHSCSIRSVHVIPVNDLKEHIEHRHCECSPKIIQEIGSDVVVHNSYDGREFMESEDIRN